MDRPFGDDFPLEGGPSDDQKRRLDDWLAELLLISRKYGLLLDTDGGDTRVIDVNAGPTGRVIGLGLMYVLLEDLNGNRVISNYECAGSIHDGVWLVEDPDGQLVEQREIGSVHRRRDEPPQ